MNIELLLIGAVSAWAIAASIVSITRDGYRRIPTRRA